MADHAKLFSVCFELIRSYENETIGVEQHLESFLSKQEQHISAEEETFVSEVLTGCLRYRALIMVVVDGFKATCGSNYLRDDFILYSILLYLVMFRLNELGVETLRKFVLTQRLRKMLQFLEFLCNKDNLHGWIRDEWCRVYDSNFVESHVMSPIMKNEKDMLALIDELREKMNRLPSPPVIPVTEPKPFNLTAPKPRSIDMSEVEEIPTVKSTKPVPLSTYRRPKLEEKLRQDCEANKRKSRTSLAEADKVKFTCTTTQKSEKTMAIMNKIISEKEEKDKLSSFKALPAPSLKREGVPVKMTTTAIMREGARIVKEEEELEKRLADLDAGGRDKAEFDKWREEMTLKDAAQQKAKLERRHLEGQLSYEEAIIAKKRNVEENRRIAKKFRNESEKLMQQYFEQRHEDQQEMRRLVEATMRGHHNTQLMKDKLTAMKRKIVQQVSKENQELMARALEEEEETMRQKVELIKQIRAAESLPALRTNFVDFTETSGYGLLSEMSIVELRERLALRTIADEEKKKAKRKEIEKEKQARQEYLEQTKDLVHKYKQDHQEQSAKNFNRNDQFKTKLLEENLKEQKIADLKEKLEHKRREREQLQDLVPAPMSSVKVTGNIAKPTAVKILPKGKATKDSYRTGATGNLSRNHTQDAMATLAKATRKT